MSPRIAAMFAEARDRLYAAIDLRAAMALARPVKSYPRRLGQIYRRTK